MMRLNTIKGGAAKKERKRVGRGSGSGSGKTCGRGYKGQKSRSGSVRKRGFEGGQMPLQRRLPKIGFSSRSGANISEIRLHEIASLDEKVIDLAVLRKAKLITNKIKRVKIILQGSIDKAVTVKYLKVTKGARTAIESAGGSIVESK